ncbi:hypothetical protein RvY_06897 [Ramazzottius varieornatus]|uniref:Uncharacterized protein n=1 Tax=Ramazzottius varieornatus TaxID=947166 RepID=A0A1D1V074_RAMVA|nr:hypothetical protein RvY_06897 [Ramazzottius varieornatus]
MVMPYAADNTDATDDAEQFLMSSGQELEADLLDLDVSSIVALLINLRHPKRLMHEKFRQHNLELQRQTRNQ